MRWRKEPHPYIDGVYLLWRRHRRDPRSRWVMVGELRLQHDDVVQFAEALAQDVVLVLNNPEMVDEWVAMREARLLKGGR